MGCLLQGDHLLILVMEKLKLRNLPKPQQREGWGCRGNGPLRSHPCVHHPVSCLLRRRTSRSTHRRTCKVSPRPPRGRSQEFPVLPAAAGNGWGEFLHGGPIDCCDRQVFLLCWKWLTIKLKAEGQKGKGRVNFDPRPQALQGGRGREGAGAGNQPPPAALSTALLLWVRNRPHAGFR